MLRVGLTFLSIALLLASTARAQFRGGGGGALRMSMSGMSGGCASGTNGTGTTSSLASTVTGGGTNATGFGTNLAAANSGIGGIANASIVGAGTNTNAGMGGYGVTAWSNPYAQATNAFGTSSAGFGAMTGMNDGPSAFGWTESYLWSDPFGVSLTATERSSTATAPRTRAKSTKAKTKVKRRVTRAQGASH
jgi:hypothetical protein